LPELPEVETVVRSIAPTITGRTIQTAQFRSRLVTQGDFERIAESIRGALIESIRRVGKHILIQLNCGVLHLHLGMTGKLLWNAPAGRHTRAVLNLDNGTLLYDDIRQFGRLNYCEDPPAAVSRLGMDALAIGFDQFFSLLRKRNGSLKSVLLNQRFISGIGNIYADEVLFAAKIHPRARACRISKTRALKLYEAMGRILQSAIEHRGSSISDYVDASGAQGEFQTLHRVYGKTGLACSNCGTPIRRILVAQRGTHYCPRCQRA
jgi:formamidopyrimidine-DNA glycosylase